MAIRLSVVVCTYNRPEKIVECIRQVRSLECGEPWELIVVDNGSTIPGYSTIVAGELALAPVPASIVSEPRPGVGAARNAGWRAATGEIVLYIDDDCYPDRTLLTAVLTCFNEAPGLGFVGGRILLHDPADHPITIQEQTHREEVLPGRFLRPGLIQGANCAFRRDALASVEGFNDRLGSGTPFACEDIEVLSRLLGAGWPGAYDPRPLVYHHHGRRSSQEVERLMRLYDGGRGVYFAKAILVPALRWTYLRRWLWLMRNQPASRTMREVTTAIRYFLT